MRCWPPPKVICFTPFFPPALHSMPAETRERGSSNLCILSCLDYRCDYVFYSHWTWQQFHSHHALLVVVFECTYDRNKTSDTECRYYRNVCIKVMYMYIRLIPYSQVCVCACVYVCVSSARLLHFHSYTWLIAASEVLMCRSPGTPTSTRKTVTQLTLEAHNHGKILLEFHWTCVATGK